MRIAWEPQEGTQVDAVLATWCDELFFGGARGGGKSDFLLGDFAQDVDEYKERWRGVLFRKTYPELEELITRSREIYLSMGAEFKEQSKTWVFPSGSTLKMRQLERDADADKYQGHQYTWIGFDELTNWASDAPYKKLRACLRSAANVPIKRIRSSGNPGGAGHQWVKAYFIDHAPLGFEPITDPDTGITRMFIPSRVQDNAILLANDPTYIQRLKGSGSEALVKAWLDGDWDVVIGAYFDCWKTDKHVIRPFKIPDSWTRFRAFDWGSFRPFSVGWWAVSDGTLPEYKAGALIRYREWYGATGPNIGLKLTAEEVAQGIKQRQAKDEKIAYSVADPSIWKVDGGPSIAERMKKEVNFRPADNQRLNGWDQLRKRLMGEDEKPMIYCFSTCVDSIRTIPALQHDETKPEDIDTDGEDHAADEWRYACMSRPYMRHPAKSTRPITAQPTFDEMFKAHVKATKKTEKRNRN